MLFSLSLGEVQIKTETILVINSFWEKRAYFAIQFSIHRKLKLHAWRLSYYFSTSRNVQNCVTTIHFYIVKSCELNKRIFSLWICTGTMIKAEKRPFFCYCGSLLATPTDTLERGVAVEADFLSKKSTHIAIHTYTSCEHFYSTKKQYELHCTVIIY